jgi:hypothetical protein
MDHARLMTVLSTRPMGPVLGHRKTGQIQKMAAWDLRCAARGIANGLESTAARNVLRVCRSEGPNTLLDSQARSSASECRRCAGRGW